MTDLQQALTIGGGIFIVMMASQYGYRDYTWHKWAMPLISVTIFGFLYLKDWSVPAFVDSRLSREFVNISES